jgi:hypothetical protein
MRTRTSHRDNERQLQIEGTVRDIPRILRLWYAQNFPADHILCFKAVPVFIPETTNTFQAFACGLGILSTANFKVLNQ